MKDRVIKYLKLFKQTFDEWNTDKAPQLAASLAFYTMFSIAPLLIIAIAIAGAVFGQQAAQNQVANQATGLLGAQGAEFLQSMIQNANKPGSGGAIATIFGVVTLLLGAAGIFNQIKGMMQTIWEVPPKPGKPGIAGILNSIREQLFSVGMVLVVGFLLLVSLLISALLVGASSFVGDNSGIAAVILQVITQIVTFGVITVIFAAMFKFFPGINVPWKDVLFGAVMTALLFTIGKYLLGVYLGQSSTTSSYGAAGSLVIVLLWIYYTAQILFFGAELTQVYSRSHGYYAIEPGLSEINPKHQAATAASGVNPSRALMVVPQPKRTVNRAVSQAQPATSEPSRLREVLWVVTAPLMFISVVIGYIARGGRRAVR